MTASEFLNEIKQRSKDGLFIVVHGFNTTLERAIYLARDVRVRLHRHGILVLYRWPSTDGLFNFEAAKRISFASGSGLAILLNHLSHVTESAPNIDVLGFSLGTEVLVQAFSSSMPSTLHDVVLIAPAVDEELARLVQKSSSRTVHRVTVYASNADFALLAERFLYGGHPFGLLTTANSPVWDIVDASKACPLSWWERLHLSSKIAKAHYYLACDRVSNDVARFLDGETPQQRGLIPAHGAWRLDQTRVYAFPALSAKGAIFALRTS